MFGGLDYTTTVCSSFNLPSSPLLDGKIARGHKLGIKIPTGGRYFFPDQVWNCDPVRPGWSVGKYFANIASLD